jgi:hypothetical protein
MLSYKFPCTPDPAKSRASATSALALQTLDEAWRGVPIEVKYGEHKKGPVFITPFYGRNDELPYFSPKRL